MGHSKKYLFLGTIDKWSHLFYKADSLLGGQNARSIDFHWGLSRGRIDPCLPGRPLDPSGGCGVLIGFYDEQHDRL